MTIRKKNDNKTNTNVTEPLTFVFGNHSNRAVNILILSGPTTTHFCLYEK